MNYRRVTSFKVPYNNLFLSDLEAHIISIYALNAMTCSTESLFSSKVDRDKGLKLSRERGAFQILVDKGYTHGGCTQT